MYKKPLFALFILMTVFSLPSASFAQALKSDLMYCGSHSTSGTNLYGDLGPFNEVSGCVPDANTQALLVTRSGDQTGHGAEWLAYLNAGGVIITEYTSTARVYNEIYGSAYTNGSYFGDCRDNAMPSLKLNTDHPFWVANAGLTPTPSDMEACGTDIAAIVNGEDEVTALGGLVGTSTIMFGIRPQGAGVFWLLEADWQDAENYWTADSSAFMAALISGGTYATPLAELVPVPTLSMIGLLLLALGLIFIGFRHRARI